MDATLIFVFMQDKVYDFELGETVLLEPDTDDLIHIESFDGTIDVSDIQETYLENIYKLIAEELEEDKEKEEVYLKVSVMYLKCTDALMDKGVFLKRLSNDLEFLVESGKVVLEDEEEVQLTIERYDPEKSDDKDYNYYIKEEG